MLETDPGQLHKANDSNPVLANERDLDWIREPGVEGGRAEDRASLHSALKKIESFLQHV